LSIKSVLSVAVILGLTCAQVQAGPKRYPWGDRTSGRDLDAHRYDTREADRLRAEWEAESYDNGDPNKGWAYDVLFMRGVRSSYSYVHPTHYGTFASKAECEQAREDMIARMEERTREVSGPSVVLGKSTTIRAFGNANSWVRWSDYHPNGSTSVGLRYGANR
jgi:hypothetical protein